MLPFSNAIPGRTKGLAGQGAMFVGVLMGLLIGGRALAHEGHDHVPVGRWFFWPDYRLEGKAGQFSPVLEAPPRAPFGLIDVEAPPLLLRGESPTERRSRLLPLERLPSRAFSVELWLVDHVNQPVGALVTVRGSDPNEAPGWALGYRERQVFFSLRAGSEPGPLVLEVAVTNGFKKYWRHVVATYDGDRARLYLNGEPVAEATAGGTVALPRHPELEVAAYLRREPYMSLGNLVREVRVYDDDIGPSQVAARFAASRRLVEEGILFEDRLHFTAGPQLTRATRASMTLVWETDRPATAVVRYGSRVPYDHEVKLGDADRLRQAALQGLEPETRYFYEVSVRSADGQEMSSGPLTFKTAVREDSAFAFAVLGDTEARPHVNDRLAKAIWGDRPDFLVLVGDLTDGGQQHHKFEWNLEYFLGMNQLVGRVPVFPVPGNGESDLHWYRRYHALSQPGLAYSFRYGNAEFFMLDSNRPLGPGSEQFTWLDRELGASRARWKFVCHHHPVYSSDDDDHGDTYRETGGEGDANPRSAVPLYEKHGVDLVFYGHIHAYERTWPMAEGRVNLQRGVRYLQTGGGGGNLEDFAPTRNGFSTKLFRGYHYCLLNVHQDELRFQMFDADGRLRDQFELRKESGLAGTR